MALRVYVDRLSQPSRAVLIFCKVNDIDFEEVKVDLAKGEQRSPDYKEISPAKKVPAIIHGNFRLFESHAIMIYLASAFPGVADHWYPADLQKRAELHSVLDWHHSNLRAGAAGLVLNSVLAPVLGFPLNPQAAAENEKILSKSFSFIESFWLKDNGKFLLGNDQPSIADLSFVCEIIQLELLDEEDRNRVLSPHKKVQHWIEDTKSAVRTQFDEVHEVLFKVKEKLRELRLLEANKDSASTAKP